MKQLYHKLFAKNINKRSDQEDLIDFINDQKNIQKAVEGSMQKRIDLIERVSLPNRA